LQQLKEIWAMLVCAILALLMLIFQLISLKDFIPDGISEKNIQAKQSYQLYLEGIKELYRAWMVGDTEGLWELDKFGCTDLLGGPKNVNSSYLACNPSVIECFGREGKMLRFKKDGGTYHMRFRQSFKTASGEKRFYRIINRANSHGAKVPSFGVQIDLELKEKPGHSLSLVLEDICGQAFLPQNTYAYGPYIPARLRKGVNDWRWDNFDRYIYIDKFLVTNRDIIDWVDYGGAPEKIKSDIGGKMLAAPATHLTKTEMAQYCSFHGKNVMQAHIYDAATFKLQADSKGLDNELFRSSYPWSTKESEGFLAQALRDPQFKVSLEDCSKAYTLDCTELVPLQHHSKESSSWIGIYQIMGGYLEYMENTLEPEKNIKGSSFYFDTRSPWHKLGARLEWDGEGFNSNNFQSSSLPEINDVFEVAFRCYREVDRAL
jgi:hypothetical protein